MSVPILDAAYMQRRAQMAQMRARLDYISALIGTPTLARSDTVESLREEYATGRIEYDERRLDRVLR